MLSFMQRKRMHAAANGLCWLTVVAIMLASPVHAEKTAGPATATLLRQMYIASGGPDWNRILAARLMGSYNLGGLKGVFNQLIDFRHGRDVLAYDLGTTRGQQGTDRTASWWTDEKSLTTLQNAPDAMADAITQSYEDRNGWFRSDPRTTAEYLGPRSADGRAFELVRMQPAGGRALTLWIDGTTHRLARVVVADAAQRENTTYLSDYRQVDGIWYPFMQRASTGDPDSDVTMTVTSFKSLPDVSDSAFSPPASVVRDARLSHNGEPSTMPFTLKGGRIIVRVSLDGRPALPFVLDSGASNLLTPEAARKVGAVAEGNLAANGVGNNQASASLAHIRKFQAGPAQLFDQQFVIVPLPPFLIENGREEPIAGLIGYEVFRRFIVRVDYHRQELTFSLPGRKPLKSSGVGLPLLFNGRNSFIEATIGRASGYFGVDTGDEGAVTLFKAFYTGHKIPIELPGIKSIQGGIGGDASTLLTRIPSLSLGSYTLTRPLAELHFATGGIFASTLIAGNLGSQALRNFILTFDYTHGVLYLQKSPDFGYTMQYNRTGIHLTLGDSGRIAIRAVNPGSPAELAGLRAGDRVIAVNHHAVEGEPYSTVEDWCAPAAGQKLELEILRAGQPIHLAIVAGEPLPPDGSLQLQADPFR